MLCSEALSSPFPLDKQDLLKHTPSSHPDYLLLQDALRISQNFLSSINEEITPRRQSMTVQKGEVSAQLAPACPTRQAAFCLVSRTSQKGRLFEACKSSEWAGAVLGPETDRSLFQTSRHLYPRLWLLRPFGWQPHPFLPTIDCGLNP